MTQLYADCLRPSGLRVTQFSILAAVARLGEASLKELEDELAIDQTTLTRSLTLLERAGVLERASHPDGRIKAHAAHIERETSSGGGASPLGAGARQSPARVGNKGVG